MDGYEIRRGDIFYISRGGVTGCEQIAGRPGIIVSNDKANSSSHTVEVVYLTTQPKADLPTHVTIRSTRRESTALCEQITTVSVERLGDFMGHVTKAEMTNIEMALLVSLDLILDPVAEKTVEVPARIPAALKEDAGHELVAAITERDTYRRLYENLLDRLVKIG